MSATLAGVAPHPELELGLELLRQAKVAEAILALERAAAAGSGPASAVLGDVLLSAASELRAPWRAIEHLELAWSRGQLGAALTLAAAHYAASGIPADDALALQWLQRALAAGVPGAYRAAGILALVAGRSAEAAAAFRSAAAAGDVFAAHALGHLAQLDGDLPLARAWYGRGAAAGLAPSKLRLAALGAGTVAILPTIVRAAPAEIVGFALPPVPPATEAPNELLAPSTWRCRGLLDPLLCDYLMAASMQWMLKAMTIDPADGSHMIDPARNSWGMNFHFAFPDLCVAHAERRIAARAGHALDHAEPLAVLRYEVGQEYRQHYDFRPSSAQVSNPYYAQAGQRVATLITYLNVPAAGGATDFPRRGLVVVPEIGTGVLFNNTLPDGARDDDSLHAGLPVLRGEKWVATLWFCENLARATVPRPQAAAGAR
jgi:prolyl 4-hydroxylase